MSKQSKQRKQFKMQIEMWDTRFGVSIRNVARNERGRFVNHKSARQMSVVQLCIDPDVLLDHILERDANSIVNEARGILYGEHNKEHAD